MSQRMEAVNRHLLITTGDSHRWFQADPTDYPEHVDVHEVVADVLTQGVRFVIAGGYVRTDVIGFTGLPRQCSLKNLKQLRSNRYGHFFTGLELLHPDSFQVEVDFVPAQQYAIFHPLSGKHTKIIDHSDFRFVHDLVLVVIKNSLQLLLLLSCKGESVDVMFTFFAFFT